MIAYYLSRIFKIQIADWKADAVLENHHNISVGILPVNDESGSKEGFKSLVVKLSDKRGKLCFIAQPFYLLEVWKQFAVATIVDGH